MKHFQVIPNGREIQSLLGLNELEFSKEYWVELEMSWLGGLLYTCLFCMVRSIDPDWLHYTVPSSVSCKLINLYHNFGSFLCMLMKPPCLETFLLVFKNNFILPVILERDWCFLAIEALHFNYVSHHFLWQSLHMCTFCLVVVKK